MKFPLIWLIMGENRVVSTFLSVSNHLFLSTVLNPKIVLYKYFFFFYSLKTIKSIIKSFWEAPKVLGKTPFRQPDLGISSFLLVLILNPLHHHKQTSNEKKKPPTVPQSSKQNLGLNQIKSSSLSHLESLSPTRGSTSHKHNFPKIKVLCYRGFVLNVLGFKEKGFVLFFNFKLRKKYELGVYFFSHS